MNIYLFVDLPMHPPRQTLLLCINQAKAVGPMACSVLQTCAPSVFFRICYGIQPRIQKYGFLNLSTETLIYKCSPKYLFYGNFLR